MCGKTLALDRLSKGEAKVGVKEEEEEEEEVPKLLEFTVKENQEGTVVKHKGATVVLYQGRSPEVTGGNYLLCTRRRLVNFKII